MTDFYDYWGKSDSEGIYHLLVYHCLDVAAVGKVWLDHSPAFVKKASVASGLTETAFLEWFLFFLALHDIGKFDIRFQNLRPDLLEKMQGKQSELHYSPRHDQRGYDFWNEIIFPYLGTKLFDNNSPEHDLFRDWLSILAVLVTGHHGQPPKSSSYVKISNSIKKVLESFVKALFNIFISSETLKSISRVCRDEELFNETELSFKNFSWQLAGLTSLCDWIASGDETFVFCSEKKGLPVYFNETCARADTAVHRAEVIPAKLSGKQGIKKLFPQFAEKLTPLQQFCDETTITGEPQLWILEDVTGAGKTEAALTLASRILGAGNETGCFIALPTMATSNAMYERMAKVYSLLYKSGSRPSLTLSHGSRYLSESFRSSYESIPNKGVIFDERVDEGKAHCSQWLADSSKKALLADVGVGTVDQILLAGLPVRYQSLRAFGLSQKVLIIDEVHAFDAYMLRLLENIILAQAVFGGSVILLSATIPFTIREKFCNAFSHGLGNNNVQLENTYSFPLVTTVSDKNGVTEQAVKTRKAVAREVSVEFCEDIEDVYELIEQSVEEGKCVCWIRNTIADVNVAYDELQNRSLVNIDMFHSRYALNDRLVIEKRVLKRFGKSSNPDERRSQVLVASQVVEQSLDLDFDVMISDLAPIDLLIQRAGRLHRHERGKRGKPVFYVHVPKDTNKPTKEWYADAFPTAKWVYRDTALLWRTKEILKKQKRLRMPEEARLLIESVYGNEEAIEAPDVFNSSEDEAWGKMMADKSQADFNKLNFNQGYCRLSSNRWDEEEKIPTRLSDETNTIYLCRWEDGGINPLYNTDKKFMWDISFLSLRKSALKTLNYTNEIQNEIDELKKQRRFAFDTLFLVFFGEKLELTGFDGKGKEVLISYNSDKGLLVEKI